jgi:hypothetical protein
MTTFALHVRIDRVTQGPEDMQAPADRLSVDREKDLWLYVEAELPGGAAPQGEYFQILDGKPVPATRVRLDPPKKMSDGQYRFWLVHYTLQAKHRYLFHFADNLDAPTYHDSWEVVTI